MKKNFAKIADTGEGKLIGTLKFISFLFTKPGLGLIKKLANRRFNKQSAPPYSEWIKAKLDPALLKKDFEANYSKLKGTPLISVAITGTGDEAASIRSVSEQLYTHYELCTAAAQPKGEYVLLLQVGDVLTPNCLYEVVKHINEHPDDALIYMDDDTVGEDGVFSAPRFKPGWSPDSLLSRNYIGNTVVLKKELAAQLYMQSNDRYDLLLRATELSTYIGHIPMLLAHCAPATHHRTADTQTLTEAMRRRQTPATINPVPNADGCYKITYTVKDPKKVSIIIPTKDNTALLKTAIDSILDKTNYPDYEIIVLNNNSSTPEFFKLMEEYGKAHADLFRCIDAGFPFNFARLMNVGVAHSTGQYILLCNNDIEVLHADWLTLMVGYAQQPHVGAVGAKLLYPDDTIQHAGIVLEPESTSRHIYANEPQDANGHLHSLKATTNYAAVTAACMLCRKAVYTEAGGMDETLEVEYNDIDLCLAMLQRGYYNVYLPAVVLYHHESATRGHPYRSRAAYRQHEHDLGIFKRKWQAVIDNDPFYNANVMMVE